jgi:hypothetical protein
MLTAGTTQKVNLIAVVLAGTAKVCLVCLHLVGGVLEGVQHDPTLNGSVGKQCPRRLPPPIDKVLMIDFLGYKSRALSANVHPDNPVELLHPYGHIGGQVEDAPCGAGRV